MFYKSSFRTSLLFSIRRLHVEPLTSRKLLKVEGDGAFPFLQGLITNNMNLIERPDTFLYSFVLNVKGRILGDTFVYHLKIKNQEPCFIVEVDGKIIQKFLHYFSIYNIRRKVKISTDKSLNVWAALPDIDEPNFTLSSLPYTSVESNLAFCAADPRGVTGWAGRLLVPSDISLDEPLSSENCVPVRGIYQRRRYELGIPEGSDELISEETLPLEANGDLNGAVCFSKGCYVGQELTARTRFTGVVRRRYLPVQLETSGTITPVLTENSPIYCIESETEPVASIRPIGFLRGTCHFDRKSGESVQPNQWREGLALLRLSEAAKASLHSDNRNYRLVTGDIINKRYCVIHPHAPRWWDDNVAIGLKRLKRTG